jgi:hypothetical protein
MMRTKHGVDFKFIWEKHVMESEREREEEGNRLLTDHV